MANLIDAANGRGAETGIGGGGSGWEQQINGPSLQFDPQTNRYVMGYLQPDGSVIPATQSPYGPYAGGYQFGPDGVPTYLSPNDGAAPTSGSGGGPGGVPLPTKGKTDPTNLSFKDLAGLMGIQGGLGVLGGLLAPGAFQRKQAFDNKVGSNGVSVDPVETLSGATGAVKSLGGAMSEKLAKPVQLRTTVQDLPSFSGGGLPMDIGVSGKDPANADPSMLQYPGLNLKNPKGEVTPSDPSQAYDAFRALGFKV